jgi:3-hydroxyacyl-CoA dehydrogenase
MAHPVWFSKADEFGIIIISNPPVNALDQRIVDGIAKSLRAAEQDDSVKAIILTTVGRTFIAGADINEFRNAGAGRRKHESLLHPLLLELEDCRKPVICAIHGSVLGGGLEIALACHYRVAASTAQIGQPEVKLGLIPGGGGTQRLPRLAGVAKAAKMCSEGNPIGAAEAFESGILDCIVEEELLPGSLTFAWDLIKKGMPLRRTRDLAQRLSDKTANAAALAAAREQARKKSLGQIAPLKAIDAVEAATQLSFDEGCRRENELFNECLFSDQSKALIHIFFAEQDISGSPVVHGAVPVIEVKKAAIVGAGSMGTGIAMTYAGAGIPVLLKEASRELLDRGVAIIRNNYQNGLKRGRWTQEHAERCMELIQPTLNYDGFSDVDIALEAVYENAELKKQIFGELSGVCKPEAILATNTSTLDIDQIASATASPSRVVGHHFFAPANIMRLIEIVRGRETADEVIAFSLALAKRLKKTGVVVGNCRGFAGNRMYHPYQREAQFLVEEGARVQDVDRALCDFGMAMGPFATRDLSGLDVAWRIQNEYGGVTPSILRQPLVINRLYEMGRLGQKTGAGWYRYKPGSREPVPDPEVQSTIEDCARQAGIQRRFIADSEIIERTIYALINEGAKILEEGVVQRAMALDVIFVLGYGFPAHRGGPMWFADSIGLKAVYRRVCEFHDQHGPYWAPTALLKQLAREGKSFADFILPGEP